MHVTKTRQNVINMVQNVTFWCVKSQQQNTILCKNVKHKIVTKHVHDENDTKCNENYMKILCFGYED